MRPIHASTSLLILLAGGATAADMPRNPGRYDFSALPAAMAAEIADGIPGGFTLMIVKDDQVVFEAAVGNKTLASAMLIASASKMPSTTLIADLIQRGLLGLDDRVADHLPFWPQSPSDPKSQITIRQCLSCTSGLPFDDTYESDASLTMDQAVQGIATLALDFIPGTRFGYTGNGFHVAGCIAEHVTGKPWAQLVEEGWAGPLGLGAFTYGGSANPRIAGGITCTSDDYARVLSVHLARGRYQGSRVFAAGMIDRMRQDEIVNQGIASVFNSPMPDDWHYGLSWWLTPPAIATSEISDPGAFGTTPWIDLERGYAAVMLMSSLGAVSQPMWGNLRPLINGAIDARRDLILVRPAAARATGATTATLTARGGAWGAESAITYTWSVVAAPDGAPAPAFAGNGGNDAQECPATLTRAGTWTFRVGIAAASAPGLGATSEASIAIPAVATGIAIAPTAADIAPGATLALAADVLDQFGQPLAAPPAVTWSCSAGTITADGILTAPAAPGPLTVTASAGGLAATRPLTVASAGGTGTGSAGGGSAGGCGVGGGAASLLLAAWMALRLAARGGAGRRPPRPAPAS